MGKESPKTGHNFLLFSDDDHCILPLLAPGECHGQNTPSPPLLTHPIYVLFQAQSKVQAMSFPLQQEHKYALLMRLTFPPPRPRPDKEEEEGL